MTDPASPDTAGPTLVLGIGNLLWADEGFGVRVVEALAEGWTFDDPEVTVMDGGTQGLYLVQYVTEARNLLVVDAVDYGRPPGDTVIVRGAEVPRFAGLRKLSLHQTGFQEVMAAAELLGGGPERVTLIGVQAGDLETWGGPLTPPVRARLAPTVDLVLAELATWGITARQTTGAAPELLAPGLGLAAWEAHPTGPTGPAGGAG
ncbi:HyaD/HybD family hydrogenase maturation endopeptidase [Roseospirillum parvum]|uniref:Hydrogenase expression/formation protein HupD n=1 Tax=Roseospirillum parvum TaxID=83401 RepID=A0A1G8B167_9PROT|nr:HyaD/HybD family hydrogenase maturation endopeptidase [Roseospirillum parvum]SDH26865.1 hydrogenase maturation protease [Roseospirillum parvum]